MTVFTKTVPTALAPSPWWRRVTRWSLVLFLLKGLLWLALAGWALWKA